MMRDRETHLPFSAEKSLKPCEFEMVINSYLWQEVTERERKISQMRASESAATGKSAKEGERAEWERQQELDRADEESRCGIHVRFIHGI